METGTRSLRRAFRNGSWSDWPLAMGISLFFLALSCRSTRGRRLGWTAPGILRTPCAARNGGLLSPRPHPARAVSEPVRDAGADGVDRPRRGRVVPLGARFAPQPGHLAA